MNNIPSRSNNKQPNRLIKTLIEYLEKKLHQVPNSKEIIDILEDKKNENQHTLAFCIFMTTECSSTFYFARENAQKGSSVVDIGVYKGRNLIFTIEAKILPIPVKYSLLRHDYEYVYGKGGGIERFKDGKHGLDNYNNPLSESGMIAFVKSQPLDYWLTKINNWIADANWSDAENLEFSLEYDHDYTHSKLNSKHLRKDGSYITLHHFWVKINQK